LNSDPFLFEECFARPVLAQRLLRSFFSSDARVASAPRAPEGPDKLPDPDTIDSATHPAKSSQDRSAPDFQAWWRDVEGDLDPASVSPTASPLDALPRIPESLQADSLSCAADNTWDNGVLDDLPDPREYHTTVWTGNVMIVWGGYNGSQLLSSGSRYDPLTDTWSSLSSTGAPTERQNHTAIWTGSVMVVWGGMQSGGSALNTGGRYNPITDSWLPVSTTNAAGGRNNHTAVWTGTQMLVWGGKSSTFALNSGGLYDPVADTWGVMTTSGAPAGRYDHVAVWSGSVMVVWGGFNSAYVNTGGRYNP
jgi:hypothetical protein